jgi:hypothetical protein
LQTQRITNKNSKSSDWFGTVVSISDKYLAIGANGVDKNENNSNHSIREGAVFLYKKDKDGQWKLMQKITPPSNSDNDEFGRELDLNGNTLIVSAPWYKRENKDFPKNSTGCVFIYQLSAAGKWSLKNQILPQENTKHFGSSISLSNSHALIASENKEIAFLYHLDNSKTKIVKQKFTNPDTLIKNFASTISITDNYLFIGAEGESNYNFFDIPPPLTDSIMIMRILTETANGYAMKKKIIPNIKSSLDSFNISKERFNQEAILYETWAQREQRKAGAGAVFIYQRETKNEWKFIQKITANDQGADDHFGMCLNANDSLLIVGAFGDKLEDGIPKESLYHGAAYVFQLNGEGKWTEIKKLTSTQNKNWLKFGFSVDTDGKKAIIGSRFEYINENEQGGDVYIWEK